MGAGLQSNVPSVQGLDAITSFTTLQESSKTSPLHRLRTEFQLDGGQKLTCAQFWVLSTWPGVGNAKVESWADGRYTGGGNDGQQRYGGAGERQEDRQSHLITIKYKRGVWFCGLRVVMWDKIP